MRQKISHVCNFFFCFDVGYSVAFILKKLLVSLHTGTMKEQLLLEKEELEKKVLVKVASKADIDTDGDDTDEAQGNLLIL